MHPPGQWRSLVCARIIHRLFGQIIVNAIRKRPMAGCDIGYIRAQFGQRRREINIIGADKISR